MRNKILTLVLCSVLAMSCSGGKSHDNTRTVENPQKLIGKTIKLPETAKWRYIDRDTVYQPINPLKIVVYVDAEGCQSCVMKQLPLWKPLMREVISDNLPVDFIFILESDGRSLDFIQALRDADMKIPVLCDADREFEKNNVLPGNELYNAFLLDAENKIIVIGKPLYNPDMWNLYKDRIKHLSQK